MKKSLLMLGLSFLAIGLVLVGISPSVGVSLAHTYLSVEGGMETTVFVSVIEGYINSVRTIGFVIALLGGLDALLSVFFLPDDK